MGAQITGRAPHACWTQERRQHHIVPRGANAGDGGHRRPRALIAASTGSHSLAQRCSTPHSSQRTRAAISYTHPPSNCPKSMKTRGTSCALHPEALCIHCSRAYRVPEGRTLSLVGRSRVGMPTALSLAGTAGADSHSSRSSICTARLIFGGKPQCASLRCPGAEQPFSFAVLTLWMEVPL